MLSSARRSAGCPPGGATYAWDEGDVKFNSGPLYVGADPFMPGANMFLDSLKVFNIALGERDIELEANDALGVAGTRFVRLGCANCTAAELLLSCSDLQEYHPCLCQELMGGALLSARSMGWLRGPSHIWQFHAEVQNEATCVLGSDLSFRPGTH